jgi:hypothetical protein
MTHYEELETGDVLPDDPQRLLILAYTRLCLLPERPNGSQVTTIMSCGAYDVRLIEVPAAMTAPASPPLWVELYDRRAGQAVDGVGCRDLCVAGAATEAFITEAVRRQASASADPTPAGPSGRNG